jgi:hypothetical protein
MCRHASNYFVQYTETDRKTHYFTSMEGRTVWELMHLNTLSLHWLHITKWENDYEFRRQMWGLNVLLEEIRRKTWKASLKIAGLQDNNRI